MQLSGQHHALSALCPVKDPLRTLSVGGWVRTSAVVDVFFFLRREKYLPPAEVLRKEQDYDVDWLKLDCGQLCRCCWW